MNIVISVGIGSPSKFDDHKVQESLQAGAGTKLLDLQTYDVWAGPRP